MVYKVTAILCKMTDGDSFEDRISRGWRRDPVFLQEKSNTWSSRLRGTCKKHSDHKIRRCDDRYSEIENLPVSDCLERGVLTRGPTRRTYKICLLEKSYACTDTTNFTKSEKSSKRKHEDSTSKPPGFVHGNKQASDPSGAIEEEELAAKRVCRDNGRIVDDSISGRVFQSLGNDLLVQWLNPEELHNVEIAFKCSFDWARVWHGGKVRDNKTAARIHFDLQRGLEPLLLLEKYDVDLAFSAFWYVLGVKELIELADAKRHYKTIRKLCNFNG